MSGNINWLYKTAGKFNGQQQYKVIREVAVVSTPDAFTKNSPMSPSHFMTVKRLYQENQSMIFKCIGHQT